MLPEYISDQRLYLFIHSALSEDVGAGDATSLATIASTQQGKAQLICKESGIVAGLELSKYIFEAVNPDLELQYFKQDGDAIQKGDVGLWVQGNSIAILTAERLVLNCLQRMSAIATLTHAYNQKISHTRAKLLDTRKTTPNFRMMEKWAVRIGGGVNHRFGLYDMVLIKDNHIDYANGIKNALTNSMQYLSSHNLDLKIVIECRTLAEVCEVLQFDTVHRILLDNMPNAMLREAVELINGQVATEASGGVTLETIKEIAETGVDYISVGALTHSYKSLDMSLKAM